MLSKKSFSKTVQLAVAAAFLAVAAVGCGGGGGNHSAPAPAPAPGPAPAPAPAPAPDPGPVTDPFYHAWYDVYGVYCYDGYPSAGCNYYSDLTQIIDSEDPYFAGYYNLEYNVWDYNDSYGYPYTYEGWGWESPTGILYDDYGYALNERDKVSGRDRALKAAQSEKKNTKLAASRLKEAHPSLSEAGATRIANNLQSWASLTKDPKVKKGRTEKDMADFSQRLFGVDFNKARAAVISAAMGNKSDLLSLKNDVGSYWGDNSANREETQNILVGWYKTEIQKYNKATGK